MSEEPTPIGTPNDDQNTHQDEEVLSKALEKGKSQKSLNKSKDGSLDKLHKSPSVKNTNGEVTSIKENVDDSEAPSEIFSHKGQQPQNA